MSTVHTRYVRQETRTSCGIACVAMLAGVGFDLAAQAVGKCGPTRTSEVVKGLRALGVSCGDRLVPLRGHGVESIPTTCVLKVIWSAKRPGRKGKDSHWIVRLDGVVLDPWNRFARSLDDYPDGKITSYLPVEAA